MRAVTSQYCRSQRTRGCRGSVAFFVAAILLPMIFFLFSISMDVSAYFTESEDAQKIVDDAALYSYRFLPSREDASRAARMFLEQRAAESGIDPAGAVVNASSDKISVLLNSASRITFARWFGIEAGIPYSVYAESRSTPLDIFIAMDTSAYLAPPAPDGTAWGKDTEWPAADFFRNVNTRRTYSESAGSVEVDPRLITQQCFNPAFSALKQSVIGLYDYLASFSLNAVGVGFFPGYWDDLILAREVGPGGLRAGGAGNPGEADLETAHGSAFASNVWCAAAAEREINFPGYTFPGRNAKISYKDFDRSLKPVDMVIPSGPENYIFNADYRPYLQTREVVWAQAINSMREPDTAKVLARAGGELLASGSIGERGGLVDRPARALIMLAGDLPRAGASRFPDAPVVSALQETLNSLKEGSETEGVNLKIYYVVFEHQGVSGGSWNAGLYQLKEMFKDISASGPENSGFAVQLFAGSDAASLTDKISASLLLDKRTVMLAR